MTEQENTRRVQEAFAAFGRGDIPALLNALTDDVEWRVAGPREVPYAGLWRGRQQVEEFFKSLGTVDIEQFEPQEFITQEDTVVVLGRERFRVKATGKAVENPWALVFRLRQGKIAQFRTYEDTAAVAAAFRGD